MIQRRYQYWGPKGIQWTPWYNCSLAADTKNKWELKGKLKAEYRVINK